MDKAKQLEIVELLRAYASEAAAAEFEAPVKHAGVMEGVEAVRQAAAFIEGMAEGRYTEVMATRYSGRITAPEQHR